jgi:ATP-dependent helicase/nuclease subunit B
LRDQTVAYEQRIDVMKKISNTVFERELARSAAALGYRARWKKAMPAYVDWANEREQQGWRFAFGEAKRETTLDWQGGSIMLHGRIDRIDTNEAGERAVLDYKTKDATSLKNRFKQLEDHQLAFYGLLSETPVDAAHYVALELAREKTGDAPAPNYAQWQAALREHIGYSMNAISEGASLPANGIETSCQYCDVRGLCRKGAWQ